jgi:hypothetical protein
MATAPFLAVVAASGITYPLARWRDALTPGEQVDSQPATHVHLPWSDPLPKSGEEVLPHVFVADLFKDTFRPATVADLRGDTALFWECRRPEDPRDTFLLHGLGDLEDHVFRMPGGVRLDDRGGPVTHYDVPALRSVIRAELQTNAKITTFIWSQPVSLHDALDRKQEFMDMVYPALEDAGNKPAGSEVQDASPLPSSDDISLVVRPKRNRSRRSSEGYPRAFGHLFIYSTMREASAFERVRFLKTMGPDCPSGTTFERVTLDVPNGILMAYNEGRVAREFRI